MNCKTVKRREEDNEATKENKERQSITTKRQSLNNKKTMAIQIADK